MLTSNTTIKILSTISLLLTINFSQNVTANEIEKICKDHVQNKIAWDPNSGYTSSFKWEEANLESLCKGTNTAEEPGECFHQVMTGHVKWGGSDKWEWKNAIKLCAGTNDADERVACFQKRIKAGEKWDAAIFQCQSNSGSLDNKVLK